MRTFVIRRCSNGGHVWVILTRFFVMFRLLPADPASPPHPIRPTARARAVSSGVGARSASLGQYTRSLRTSRAATSDSRSVPAPVFEVMGPFLVNRGWSCGAAILITIVLAVSAERKGLHRGSRWKRPDGRSRSFTAFPSIGSRSCSYRLRILAAWFPNRQIRTPGTSANVSTKVLNLDFLHHLALPL